MTGGKPRTLSSLVLKQEGKKGGGMKEWREGRRKGGKEERRKGGREGVPRIRDYLPRKGVFQKHIMKENPACRGTIYSGPNWRNTI